jgi:hypothetical protein
MIDVVHPNVTTTVAVGSCVTGLAAHSLPTLQTISVIVSITVGVFAGIGWIVRAIEYVRTNWLVKK